MKQNGVSGMLIGAALAFLATGAYVLFGPKDFLGAPEPLWAVILFYPGIFVAALTQQYLSWPMPASYAMGVAAMTVVGAMLGAIFDWLADNSGSSPRPQ